jgi:hypothetical protein
MRKQCPQCKEIMEIKVAICDGCRLSFFHTSSNPKDLTSLCVRIAAAAFVASGVVIAFLLRP